MPGVVSAKVEIRYDTSYQISGGNVSDHEYEVELCETDQKYQEEEVVKKLHTVYIKSKPYSTILQQIEPLT